MLVEGDVAPLSWHPDLVTEVIEEDDFPTAMTYFEGALLWYTLPELSALGIETSPETGLPLPQEGVLKPLALPPVAEGVARLGRLTEGRKALLDATFTWLSDSDCEKVGT